LTKYQHFIVQPAKGIMKILVIGNAEQTAECKEKFGPSMDYGTFPSWREAGAQAEKTDVVFDFVSAHEDLSSRIPSTLSATLFVDTSQSRLADWKIRYGVIGTNTYGFCGLKTFLHREVLEVVLPAGGNHRDLEPVCSSLGTPFEVVADQAGMVTPRVICMIINEAFYTLEEGTATKEDIDLAMKLGTNYPYGPFEWASRIGLQNVLSLLEAVYRETRDERYRVCPLLIEQVRLAQV
jgi:3-hydroxybutyryl-CoA dehydrogenase